MWKPMNEVINKKADFCVCGGGLAGVSAAVSAARNGLKVILCNDRPVLGGNSSSEFRVWVSGAVGLGNNRYADEGGVIGELIQESLYKNPEGNPFLWDAYVLDCVKREKNIELLLNTSVAKAFVEGGRITSILLKQITSEKTYSVSATYFADCTGDGYLGYIAGAGNVWGGQDETNADGLPFELESENFTLGSSILFYKKKLDHPVRYIRPEFAYSKEEIEKAITETHKIISLDMNGCDYWWLEIGGDKNTISDSEEIRFELHRIIYGIWDYIKNSGKFDADNYSLEWVGSIPGRRETRRLLARHTLTTEEVAGQKPFEDAVSYGGWPIDVHPCGGFFDEKPSCLQIDTGVYQIPLGSLIAADFENLFLAGRDAGMTHGAMASARVMKTCALMGQGIGTAAAVAVSEAIDPADFSAKQFNIIQQALLKDDVWLIDVPHTDSGDLVKTAVLSTSGEASFAAEQNGGWLPLDRTVCLVFPPLPEGTSLTLFFNACKAGANVQLEVFESSKLQNHDLAQKIEEQEITFDSQGETKFVLKANWGATNTLVRIRSAEEVSLGLSVWELPGVLGVVSETAKGLNLFRPAVIAEGFSPYKSENLADGYNRPLGNMHNWVCEVPAEVSLKLKTVSDVEELHFYFDSSLSRAYNNLRPEYMNPEEANKDWLKLPDNLAKDFSVEFVSADGMQQKVMIRDNYRRHVVIRQKIRNVTEIRVRFESSWGEHFVSVFEIRAYAEDTSLCH